LVLAEEAGDGAEESVLGFLEVLGESFERPAGAGGCGG
jgi:hypothetical protein